MDCLTVMPEELINDIIERVNAVSPESLPNIGLTCKTLRRLSHPLQWKAVVLPWRLNKKSPIARFSETHHANENVLSVRLQPQRSVMNAFKIGMKNAHDHLDALCDCLGSLSNLNTFSIFLDDLVDSRCTLPGPVLAKIIRALPPSLLHLEIDTEGVDRIAGYEALTTPAEPADHLCLAISDRVPHLESLRLRLSCLCTQVFRTPSQASKTTSKLRRAFIRFDTSPGRESHLAIPVDVTDCELSHGAPAERHMAGEPYRRDRNALKMQKMMTHLMDLREAGAFPQLERFILWKWLDCGAAEDAEFRIGDIATRSITHYPKLLMPFQRWDVPGLGDMNHESVYMVRDHNEDWLGDRKHLEAALLYEVSWREMADGIRLPPVGKLDNKETRLCPGGLIPWEIVKAKEEEQLRNGEEPRLPDVTAFAATRVSVDKL
jgi:hypothetical protein